MLGLSFFSRPKARQFNYQPRYYDPKKEETEARKRRVLGDKAVDHTAENQKYVPGLYIQKARVNRISIAPSKKEKKRIITVRFIIFLVVLGLITYTIISTSFFDIFVKNMLKTV